MTKKIIKLVKQIWHKGLVHILTGNFLTKLVSFFGSIFLIRVLSKEDYGILGYLENIYGYVLVLAGMGLSNAILRYVVKAETIEEKQSFFNYAYRKGFLWNIVLIALAALISIFYPHSEKYQNYVWLLYFMLLGLPFQYLTDNVLCNERAMFANQRYAVFSFILSASIIFSKILSGYFGGIQFVIFAQITVYALMAWIMMVSTKRKYYARSVPATLSRQTKKEMDGYSFQYMITNGLWTIFMLNDTFIIGRFFDPSVLAEYKVAYAIPGSITLISSALGIFIAPYFVKHEEDRPWIQKNYIKVLIATAILVGIICFGIGVLAKPVIWLLYGEEYLNIVPVMRVLLISSFCNCGLRFTTANILAAMGQVKYNMVISAIGTILQFIVNLFAAPVYGVISVAITSCIVYALMAASLLIIFILKYYKK